MTQFKFQFLLPLLQLCLGIGSQFNTSTLADYSIYSGTPQFLLGAAYQDFGLPTYGININQDNLTAIYLTKHEGFCNWTTGVPSIDDRNIFDSRFQVWLCIKILNPAQCDPTWDEVTGCGTFLEVHYPFNQTVLASVEMSQYDNQNPIGMSLQALCAGNYHVWLVVNTRIGKVITRVAPMYIYYPSC